MLRAHHRVIELGICYESGMCLHEQVCSVRSRTCVSIGTSQGYTRRPTTLSCCVRFVTVRVGVTDFIMHSAQVEMCAVRHAVIMILSHGFCVSCNCAGSAQKHHHEVTRCISECAVDRCARRFRGFASEYVFVCIILLILDSAVFRCAPQCGVFWFFAYVCDFFFFRVRRFAPRVFRMVQEFFSMGE